MVAGSQGMIALGQVKQPMKCVQSSPLLDPGAVPESGSLQSKPNIVTAGPRGDDGLTIPSAGLRQRRLDVPQEGALKIRDARAIAGVHQGSLYVVDGRGDVHVVGDGLGAQQVAAEAIEAGQHA